MTSTMRETPLGEQPASEGQGVPVPGAVLISIQGRPVCAVFDLKDGRLVIGRDTLGNVPPDPLMSRTHVELRLHHESFSVRDLGSRNGTFVDGSQVHGHIEAPRFRYLRAGSSFFLLCQDVRPVRSLGIGRVGDMILGPSLATPWRTIARLACAGSNMFLHGESGAGKERAVQAFHAFGLRSARPLVAVNCGAIPEGMAERLLFGTKRGAYSGAVADAKGYIQAADGGVLFLDEVAELDLGVQAKLLRVLETKEVMPLGENRPCKVDFQLCAATHKDLRGEVARGRFREDLYFRLARPEVHLPPLRERIEEIPWLIDMAVAQVAEQALSVHFSFVETCLQRSWPGNVRELLVETRAAAHQALAQGSTSLKDVHLASGAGTGFVHTGGPKEERKEERKERRRRKPREQPGREALERILREHRGNVTVAARALGVHRTQFRRWLARCGLDATQFTKPSRSSTE
jgi:transcriptional regulator with GAF, ATPase, and Fis domain